MYGVFSAPFRALLVETVLPFLGGLALACVAGGWLLARAGKRA